MINEEFKIVRSELIECVDVNTNEKVFEYSHFHDYWVIAARFIDTTDPNVANFKRIDFESNIVELHEITQARYDKFKKDCEEYAKSHSWGVPGIPLKAIKINLG